MAKSTKSVKKRPKLEKLPSATKTLTAKEAKNVKGGWLGDVHQPLNITGHELTHGAVDDAQQKVKK